MSDEDKLKAASKADNEREVEKGQKTMVKSERQEDEGGACASPISNHIPKDKE